MREKGKKSKRKKSVKGQDEGRSNFHDKTMKIDT